MSLEENSGSIFSKLKKDPAPGPKPAAEAAPQAALPPPPPPRPNLPPPPPLPPVRDERLAGLEAAVLALQSELDAVKNRPAPQAAPLPPTVGGEEFAFRLARTEQTLEQLRKQLAADEESAASRAGKAVSKDEVKNIDLRITDLAASLEGLGRAFAREGELAARLERAEAAIGEIKTLQPGQQSQIRASLDALAPREEVDALRVNVSGALESLEEMKSRLSLYSEEFSGVERGCRKALGEMQGYVKSAEQKPMAEKFDEYLKESVARLSDRLAEAETAMHAGLAELSGRLTANEILYKKIFTEAEERLRKSVEPELKSVDGQLKWLRENMIRLSDDYTVVAERKMRALEGKYAAFEAIARRMDAIDAALKMGGKIGLP
ncbi:MAG: hypothetical protein COX65_04895 [Elusimicrobia bacterium CG_4_10_14_0_2_um_filter_56_8]|nr:MAG: hypothetical protein AUJ51_06465 [Elusimicrobia bacterium CG1_02_56_21]PJA14975.1 MAG: hypothetical protein COX65_04895 [Elusimicrobia bacterium CG_4_10_14_0_2_um_filter_56_8]